MLEDVKNIFEILKENINYLQDIRDLKLQYAISRMVVLKLDIITLDSFFEDYTIEEILYINFNKKTVRDSLYYIFGYLNDDCKTTLNIFYNRL